jgi:hypothetical protein
VLKLVSKEPRSVATAEDWNVEPIMNALANTAAANTKAFFIFSSVGKLGWCLPQRLAFKLSQLL